MIKTQKRIGAILFIFSSVLYLIKIMTCIVNKGNMSIFISMPKILYPILIFIFAITYIYNNNISRFLQCFIILLTGIFSLYPTSNNSFFGLTMIVVSIILAFSYKFFEKNKKLKIIMINIFLYILFSFVCLDGISKQYVHGIEWIMFIDFFLFVLWFIFKDSIEQLKQKETSVESRLIEERDKAIQLTEDLIALAKEMNERVKKLTGGKNE